jgi:hypothetical protein
MTTGLHERLVEDLASKGLLDSPGCGPPSGPSAASTSCPGWPSNGSTATTPLPPKPGQAG